MGGLNGVEIYYFDPLILVFLFVGFLTWGFCRSGGRAKVVFSRCLAGLIWAYLTALLILIFSISSSHSFWLQPGIVMVFLGYLTLSAGGIFDFFNWLKAKLKRSSVPRSKRSLG